jgi:hypothetical protein
MCNSADEPWFHLEAREARGKQRSSEKLHFVANTERKSLRLGFLFQSANMRCCELAIHHDATPHVMNALDGKLID